MNAEIAKNNYIEALPGIVDREISKIYKDIEIKSKECRSLNYDFAEADTIIEICKRLRKKGYKTKFTSKAFLTNVPTLNEWTNSYHVTIMW